MRVGESIHGYQILSRIDIGGSDRKFFRGTKNNDNYVIVQDKDIEYYLRLQKHLFKKGVAVPKVYWFDLRKKLIVIEDLGSDSLYSLALKQDDYVRFYYSTIDALLKLQIDGYPNAPVNFYYDYEHIRWEQEYFRIHFLGQFCEISAKNLKPLDADFENLTVRLIKQTKTVSNFLMHRDYQSQNIYIKNNRIRIIDFQSARIGPLTYDLASLLRDAYVNIASKIESRLIDYYLYGLEKKNIKISKRKFMMTYHLTGLQRNMQALGAFANLSLNKQKPIFKKYIPRGLALLKSGLEISRYKKLERLVKGIVL